LETSVSENPSPINHHSHPEFAEHITVVNLKQQRSKYLS